MTWVYTTPVLASHRALAGPRLATAFSCAGRIAEPWDSETGRCWVVDGDRLARASGGAAVVVTMSTILLAMLLSPAFTVTGNALSNLGVTETAAGTPVTVVLFNGGLVVGGLLGVVFARTLWRLAGTTGERAAAGLFALTMTLMGAVGVFPQGTALHFPVAGGFYLCASLALWGDGLVSFLRGASRRAVAGLVSGTVNIGGWVLWSLTGDPLRDGLAIPELVGALALSAWAVWVSWGLLQGRW